MYHDYRVDNQHKRPHHYCSQKRANDPVAITRKKQETTMLTV